MKVDGFRSELLSHGPSSRIGLNPLELDATDTEHGPYLQRQVIKELITGAGTRGLVHQNETDTGGMPNGVVEALQRRFLVLAGVEYLLLGYLLGPEVPQLHALNNLSSLEDVRTLYGLASIVPPALARPWLLGLVMLAWIVLPLTLAVEG